jgi:hypothetical protein
VLQQQPAFLAALESGLKDHQDVKAPAHLMLVKLAASPGGVCFTCCVVSCWIVVRQCCCLVRVAFACVKWKL